MPIHDWTRLHPGDWHDFHQGWTIRIRDALNGGGLPSGYMAMAEQVTAGPVPDVVTLRSRRPRSGQSGPGGVAVADAPPSARVIARKEEVNYARRANRLAIRRGRGEVVAVIELVSPGNKSSDYPFQTFVRKSAEIIDQGVNLLVVDLFPPTPRDPFGMHKAVWDQFGEEPFVPPPDKPLTVASYIGGELPVAYVEPVGVGDRLPDMALFLSETRYVPCPLESTYMQAWAVFPAEIKEEIEPPGGAGAAP